MADGVRKVELPGRVDDLILKISMIVDDDLRAAITIKMRPEECSSGLRMSMELFESELLTLRYIMLEAHKPQPKTSGAAPIAPRVTLQHFLRNTSHITHPTPFHLSSRPHHGLVTSIIRRIKGSAMKFCSRKVY